MSQEPAPTPLPLANHLSALVDQRLAKLIKCIEECQRERSVETVHDLRVASRRLRAFAVTFADVLGDKLRGRLEKKLQKATKAVGALRDLDVQVGLLEERSVATSNELERASLEHLLEHLSQQRMAVDNRAEKRLRKLDTEAMSRLVQHAARSVIAGLPTVAGQRDYARTLLERLVADASEQVPATDGAEDAERLHRLRIDCKEIRYALEFFEPVLGSHFEVLYQRATSLQDLLGTYRDWTTLDEVAAERGAELERNGRYALRMGMKSAQDDFAQQRQALLERFRARGFDANWWRATLSDALATS